MKKIKKQIILIILTLTAILVTVSTCSAVTIYVNTTGDDTSGDGSADKPFQTIQKGYDNITDGDTLQLADGQYIGTGNTNITIAKNLTIQGQSQSGTIINGKNTNWTGLINIMVDGPVNNWIFQIQPGYNVTIQNLTITGGSRVSGGAIVNNGTLNVVGSNLTGNHVINNGGAINNHGTLNVVDSIFTGNAAHALSSVGGAIYNAGTLFVTDSTFTGNNAFYGGAILGGTSTVTGSTFTENWATCGGAIYSGGGTLFVTDSTFTENSASYGGAIQNIFGTLSVTDSTFRGNSVQRYGGAIANGLNVEYINFAGGTLNVVGSTFNGNNANGFGGGFGGAIYNYNGTLTAHFNRIYNNTALNGNAIYCNGSTINAENNWWGSNANPTSISNLIILGYGGTIDADPWVILTINANPTTINKNEQSIITADLNHINGDGDLIGGHIPDGQITLNIPWGSFIGSLTPHSITLNTVDGIIIATFLANGGSTPSPNPLKVTATADGYTTNNAESAYITINDAPVANPDTATTNEDTSLDVNVRSNDNDPDGDLITVTSVFTPNYGTTSIVGGNVRYTPNSNYNGLDSFTYTISDGKGGTAIGTVTITVIAVNDAPVANSDSKTTDEDTSVSGKVTATDVDKDTLTYTQGTGPSNGTVIVNSDGTYTYTPDADFNGDDSFTIIVSDGNGGKDTATVTITVNAVNDVPVANDETKTTDEDTPLSDSLSGSDVDGNPLNFALKTGPAHGTVIVNSDGTYTYTPDANYNGPDSFKFTVNDAKGETDEGTISITVNSVNDNPVAIDDSATTKEETPITINVRGNDSDVDKDSLTLVVVSNPKNGSIKINADGTVTYTPNANFYSTDSFTYTIIDGNGGTATGTVTVNVAQKVSSIYVITKASKNNPTVGETIKITFKLGNNGPETAENVKFTYKLPEGLEFAGMNGDGTFSYDAATRTITWNLGDVPVGDPYLYVNVKVLKAGSFLFDPRVTTDTFDNALPAIVQSATVNAVNVAANETTTVNAVTTTEKSVGMQKTGLPIAGLILAMLAVCGGFLVPKRK